MKTKPLYILISDGGDGSYYPRFTFNSELIVKLQEAHDNGSMDYENGVGCDGDGFHYSVLNVPVACTMESLGINQFRVVSDDYADRFVSDEDEDEE